ncbi:MAG: glycosyltransferase family 39 protein [Candidatus Aenigmarchaeota archaeon]|nr:glycosyltransferase family 39 protein [Candidatus Aenigmarchaeota archaeon]
MVIEMSGSYQNDVFGLWYMTHTVEVMSIIFAVFIILFLLNINTIFRAFKKVKKETWLILLSILVIGFLLRSTNYVYGNGYDGLFSPASAKVLLNSNIQAWNCAMGSDENCYTYSQNLAPPGYSYLIFLSFIVFGVNDINAMIISSILGTLNILIIFLISYLLFKNERVGLYAAVCFALIPFDIVLSATSGMRTTSLFFTGFAFLIFTMALKKHDVKMWSLAAISLSYSIYVRQENFLMILPMMLFFIIEKKAWKNTMRRINTGLIVKYFIPLAIFIVSQIPVQHWVMLADRGPSMFVLSNFPIVSIAIIKMLLYDPILRTSYYNILMTSAFFISLLFIFKRRNKESKLMCIIWLWFLSYFVMYSAYLQCIGFPEVFCYEYLRYTQGLLIPYAILAGIVLFNVENFFKRGKNIIFVIIFVIIISTSLLVPFSIYKFKPLFTDGRATEHYVGGNILAFNMTPENSIVFMEQASVQHFDYFSDDDRIVIDVNIYTWNNHSTAKTILSDNIGRPIYFIDGYACREINNCGFIHDNFNMKKIIEIYPVILYELELK